MTNLIPRVILGLGGSSPHILLLFQKHYLPDKRHLPPWLLFRWSPTPPAMDFYIVAQFGLLFNFPQIVDVGKDQQEPKRPRSRDDEQLSQKQLPPQGFKAKL